MLELSLKRNLANFSIDAQLIAEAGSITALFGRSGAGKTSVINMIAGLLRPDEGYVRVGGVTLFDSASGIDVPVEDRRIGYVFQDGRLFPHMSVRRNLAYGVRRAGTSSERFDTVVRLLDLAPLLDRQPATLSGGEKQRVAIGRALLSGPRLLLMDEPLAGIDIQRREEILPFIERLREDLATTIIYVSHEIEEVIRLADSLALISEGRIAAVGGVEDLMSRLDLKPLTGRYESGAVLATMFDRYESEFGLGHLKFDGGVIRVAGLDLPEGTHVRAHIRSRDVSLALNCPKDSSVLNIFEGHVVEIGVDEGAQMDVRLDIGAPLIARLTRKSVHDLELGPGKAIFALVKAVAIDRRSLGRPRKERR